MKDEQITEYFKKTKIAVAFDHPSQMREILQCFGIKRKVGYCGAVSIYRFKNQYGVYVKFIWLPVVLIFIKKGFTVISFAEFKSIVGDFQNVEG